MEETDEYFVIQDHEKFWVNNYHFLLSRGYQLRARYRPGWVPSWKTGRKKDPRMCKDSWSGSSHFMDACRIDDGMKVVLKRAIPSTDEIPIGLYVSSHPRTEDSRNHCIRFLDVILMPGNDDLALIVSPLLYNYNLLPFRHVGEICELVQQMIQSLAFLHDHNIAHRDSYRWNIMMDPRKVIPKGFHLFSKFTHDGQYLSNFSWKTRWSVRPVQYYLIDFDMSLRYSSRFGNLQSGKAGQDKTVPEMNVVPQILYDPFPVDVYMLGHGMHTIIEEYTSNEDLDQLAKILQRMMKITPGERITAQEASECVDELVSSLSNAQKSSRIWKLKTQFSPWDRFLVTYFGYNPVG